MRVFGLDISLRRSGKTPLNTTPKQPATLIQAIGHHLASHGDWKVKLMYRDKKSLAASPFMTTTVSEFARVVENIEDYLREEHGAADFKIGIYDQGGVEVATYDVPVAGPKAFRPVGGFPATATDSNLTKSGGKLSEVLEIVTAVKAFLPEAKDPMELVTQVVGMVGQLQGGASEMDTFAKEVMAATFNNNLSEKENMVTHFTQLAELQAALAPKIPTEDTTTALIGAIPALASAFMMMKGGGQQPAALPLAAMQPGGNGGVAINDVNALRAFAQSVPQEVMNLLPADQQQALNGLRGTPGAVALPRPGVPETPAAPAQPPVQPPAQPAEAADVAESISPTSAAPTETSPYNAAIDAMVEEIREGLRGETTDNEIARKILTMVTVARGFSEAEPHPLLKDLLTAEDDKTGEHEFRRFCAAIPELREQQERIDTIGLEMILLMQEGAKGTLETIGDDFEDQVSVAQTPTFQHETEEAMKAQTEEKDVLRPAGIPEKSDGAVRPDEPDADRKDGAEIREESADTAQAV